jgi:hypothetical protein
MPKSEEPLSSLDVRYLKKLYEELVTSSREQTRVMSKMEKHVGEMGVILKSLDEKQADHAKKLEKYEERIRKVEKTQYSCNAQGQIRGLWAQVRGLNAFKDAALDRSREDSQVFNIRTIDGQVGSSEATLKASAIRMLPWFVVVFVVGVVLATMVVFQAFSGKQIIDISAIQTSPAKVDK